MDKGTITFFDLKEVGFYTKSKDGEAEKVTGSLIETIGNLAEWVLQCNSFTDTIPWDVDSHKKRTPIYSKIAHTDPTTNDTLFVFWLGDEEQETNRRGIKADAKIGSFQNDSVNLQDAVSKDKTIVGHAMYYWFIPSHNLLATIDFSHSRLKSDEVFEYIKRCVRNKLDLSTPENNLIRVIDTVETPSGTYTNKYYKCAKSGQQLYFRFDAKRKLFSSSTVNLKKLARTITHVVVRDKVSYSPDDSMGNELKMLSAFFNVFKGKKDNTDRKPIEYIEQRSVTESELKQLIVNSENELEEDDDWIGMGFQSGANDTPKFFKSFIHRPSLLLNNKYSMGNYYDAKYFLTQLMSQRDSLILSLPTTKTSFDLGDEKETNNEKIDN